MKSVKSENEKKIDLQKLELKEDKLPLLFSNLVRLHVDPFHAKIVFGYLATQNPQSAEAVMRVAMPIQTLVSLRNVIDNILHQMEKDGVLNISPHSKG